MVLSEVLGGVDARLKGDAGITALVPTENIGNYLAQDTGFPHMLYQLDAETLRIKGEDSQEMDLQIDIWTRYRGHKEGFDIADAVRNALDGVPIAVASADGFGCSYESMDSFIEPEGTVYRITMRFVLLYGAA